MTITDVGILLVVLCVLLWAIMAALHRHTVQLNALQRRLDDLLQPDVRRGARENAAAGSPYLPSEPEHGAGHVAGAPANTDRR